jgi:hypothetical protein
MKYSIINIKIEQYEDLKKLYCEIYILGFPSISFAIKTAPARGR